MKKPSKTEERVAQMQERFQLVMPEVRRQIAVYEKRLKEGTLIKPSKVISQSGNV